MRRLPIYILIETSDSMKGTPIESVKAGVETMLKRLRNDPYALETVCISIITYDKEARIMLPLTPIDVIDELQILGFSVSDHIYANTGRAFKLLCKTVDSEVKLPTPNQRGDWCPIVVLMTKGTISDLETYSNIISEIWKRHFCDVIAYTELGEDNTALKLLTRHVFDSLEGLLNHFYSLFSWDYINSEWRANIKEENKINSCNTVFSPAPAEVNLVI